MDAGKIAAHFGASLASGLIVTFAITTVILPASFMMNRYIYHHWLMRLTMGAVGGFMGFGAFVILMGLILSGKIGKAHYFGLFPVKDLSTGISSGWVMPAFLGWILNPLLHPFQMYWDEPAYATAVEALLAKKGDAVVNEEVFKLAREAAAMGADKPAKGEESAVWTSWAQFMKKIAGLVTAVAPTPE
jgi:hypothetical protein